MDDVRLKNIVLNTLKGFGYDIVDCLDFDCRETDGYTSSYIASFSNANGNERVFLFNIINEDGQMVISNIVSI